MKDVELFNDNFQNYKSYSIPKAQLILTVAPDSKERKSSNCYLVRYNLLKAININRSGFCNY